jgi:hypothetical protein
MLNERGQILQSQSRNARRDPVNSPYRDADPITRVLAKELRPRKIRVNTIAPAT